MRIDSADARAALVRGYEDAAAHNPALEPEVAADARPFVALMLYQRVVDLVKDGAEPLDALDEALVELEADARKGI